MWNVNKLRNLIPAKLRRTPIFLLKTLKENGDLFADYIYGFLNDSTDSCNFPFILKLVNVAAVFKKSYRNF